MHTLCAWKQAYMHTAVENSLLLNPHTYVCLYTHTYTRTHAQTHTHTHTHIHMRHHMHMHAHLVCMEAVIHTYRLNQPACLVAWPIIQPAFMEAVIYGGSHTYIQA